MKVYTTLESKIIHELLKETNQSQRKLAAKVGTSTRKLRAAIFDIRSKGWVIYQGVYFWLVGDDKGYALCTSEHDADRLERWQQRMNSQIQQMQISVFSFNMKHYNWPPDLFDNLTN